MKNRTAIGIVCVILAVVITFVVSPMVTRAGEGKKEVVRFINNISQGAKISEKDIETVKIAKTGIPHQMVRERTMHLAVNTPQMQVLHCMRNGRRIHIRLHTNQTAVPVNLRHRPKLTE